MSIKDEMNKFKETYKEGVAKEQAKQDAKSAVSEQEKLAKTGNFVMKGCAFWFLIPVFLIIAIILVFAGFALWDAITG